MNIARQVFIFGVFLCICGAFPQNRNPNLEFELISNPPNDAWKPALLNTTTHKPIVIKTPPPVDPNSKTFAYNAQSQTWTELKKGDPPPSKDTLLWNQSNDKFLTNL